jgi:hypothetical protein
MKFYDFQARWARSWPKSWNSLFKWLHIVHMCAYWDCKQSSYWEFSFSMHKKTNFPFSKCQDWVFCEGSSENTLQNETNLIFNNSRTHFMYISPFFVCMKLCINRSQKKTNSCRFSRKRGTFELQLYHSLPMIFSKNHFQVHK